MRSHQERAEVSANNAFEWARVADRGVQEACNEFEKAKDLAPESRSAWQKWLIEHRRPLTEQGFDTARAVEMANMWARIAELHRG
ncbi:hypothetical protein ACWD2L_06055 [Streptomyces sp. NPDC002754]